ncbi:hypothetical protein BJ741DRAFT_606153 [Chytriomyces cf. hyalinus JEL632]|nr:hypothetical protein BJ741DRAFT_606153 [Chytriomyces cf. hyalinus JEL632]
MDTAPSTASPASAITNRKTRSDLIDFDSHAVFRQSNALPPPRPALKHVSKFVLAASPAPSSSISNIQCAESPVLEPQQSMTLPGGATTCPPQDSISPPPNYDPEAYLEEYYPLESRDSKTPSPQRSLTRSALLAKAPSPISVRELGKGSDTVPLTDNPVSGSLKSRWLKTVWNLKTNRRFRLALGICVAVFLSVVVGILLFWKVGLPRLIQNVFANGDLSRSKDALYGITLFSVTNLTSTGIIASVAMRKTGFSIPLNVPAHFSNNSLWQFEIMWPATVNSTMNDTAWHPLLQIRNLPSEITLENGVLRMNATDTDVQVVDAGQWSRVASVLSRAGVGNGGNSSMSDEMPFIKCVCTADVTVARVFKMSSLRLENVVHLQRLFDVTGAGADVSTDVPPFVSNTTTDMARVNDGAVATSVNMQLFFRNETSTENQGSPIAFPALMNMQFRVQVNGQDAAVVQIPKVGLTLRDTIFRVPLVISQLASSSGGGGSNARGGGSGGISVFLSDALKAVRGSGTLESKVGSLIASSANAAEGIFGENRVELNQWTLGGVQGQNEVPAWVGKVLDGIDMAVLDVGGSGSVFVGLVLSVLQTL